MTQMLLGGHSGHKRPITCMFVLIMSSFSWPTFSYYFKRARHENLDNFIIISVLHAKNTYCVLVILFLFRNLILKATQFPIYIRHYTRTLDRCFLYILPFYLARLITFWVYNKNGICPKFWVQSTNYPLRSQGNSSKRLDVLLTA